MAFSEGSQHLQALVARHIETYRNNAGVATAKLADVWAQLDVGAADQVRGIEEAIVKATNVWSAAVEVAEEQQRQMREAISVALHEIEDIKRQLGDERSGRDHPTAQTSHSTLRAWLEEAREKREVWLARRTQRIAEYEEIQTRLRRARSLIGAPNLAAVSPPDISGNNMAFLRLELDKLQAEKAHREKTMQEKLDRLKGMCVELGEDDAAAASDVHPSLMHMWDRESAATLRGIYSMAGCGLGEEDAPTVDLSDATFTRLGHKLDALSTLKAEREKQAAQLLGVLSNMYAAMGIPADSPDRSMYVKIMSGPMRLHCKSISQLIAEVDRLEEAKVTKTLEIVHGKARELLDLCAETHITPPEGLDAKLRELGGGERTPGAAANLLTQLVHMLSKVQVVADKRAGIISQVREVEDARGEDAWLRDYEADEQRYKGRDANKKLQRAIRAGKLRERLPSMIEGVREAMAAWRESEGAPFKYDGRDYQAEVLDVLAVELQAAATGKAAKKELRRSSVAGATPGPAPGSASKPPPGTPISLRSGTPAAGGRPQSAAPVALPHNRTPIPKVLSGRALAERHSYTFARSASAGHMLSDRQLSRSGEVHLPRPVQRTPPPSRRTPPAGGVAAPGAAGTPTSTPTSSKLASILSVPAVHSVATLQDFSGIAAVRTPEALVSTPDIYINPFLDQNARSSMSGGGSGSLGSGALGTGGGTGAKAAAATGGAPKTPGSDGPRSSRIPQPMF